MRASMGPGRVGAARGEVWAWYGDEAGSGSGSGERVARWLVAVVVVR